MLMWRTPCKGWAATISERNASDSFVAMQDAALATFFVIEHEGQGDARIAGPVRVGRVVAVSDQVAWVVSAHSSVPYCGWGGGPDGPGMP